MFLKKIAVIILDSVVVVRPAGLREPSDVSTSASPLIKSSAGAVVRDVSSPDVKYRKRAEAANGAISSSGVPAFTVRYSPILPG